MPTLFSPDHPWFVHTFRGTDDQVHVVISLRRHVRRHANLRATCAFRLADSQRLAPHHDATRNAPVTCASCLVSFTGFDDLHARALGD